MKRSYLKRKPSKLKRSPIKRVSSKGVLMVECDKLQSEIMKQTNKPICQLCGNPNCKPLGVFHIFCKGEFPKLRYSRENLLWVGYSPCHRTWHNDAGDRLDRLREKVNHLRPDYRNRLKVLNAISPSITANRLGLIKLAFEQELKNTRS